MTEHYPIHPTLDQLIQKFKQFSQVTFPRGIPDLKQWAPLVKGLTTYERFVIEQAQIYMSGQAVDTTKLKCDKIFLQTLQSFATNSLADSNYMKNFLTYKNDIDILVNLIEDCIEELGNPAKSMVV